MKPRPAISFYPVKIWGLTILLGSLALNTILQFTAGYKDYPFFALISIFYLAIYFLLPVLIFYSLIFDYFISPRILKSSTKKALLILLGLSPFLIFSLIMGATLTKNVEYFIILGCYSIALIVSTILLKLPSASGDKSLLTRFSSS